jgi:hypothetical protein
MTGSAKATLLGSHHVYIDEPLHLPRYPRFWRQDLTQNKRGAFYPLFLLFLGLALISTACSPLGKALANSNQTPDPTEVLTQIINQPRQTFELSGPIQSMQPWKVGGVSFATQAATVIPTGLKLGDQVKVTGQIQTDGTWMATQIRRVEGQTQPQLVLVGVVNSTNPWVVSGIAFKTSADTVVVGNIQAGNQVRVQARLLEDGTWEAIKIELVQTPTKTPTRTSTVSPNQTPEVQGDRVTICHKPGKKNGGMTMTLPRAALGGHLGHGDTLGPCK